MRKERSTELGLTFIMVRQVRDQHGVTVVLRAVDSAVDEATMLPGGTRVTGELSFTFTDMVSFDQMSWDFRRPVKGSVG